MVNSTNLLVHLKLAAPENPGTRDLSITASAIKAAVQAGTGLTVNSVQVYSLSGETGDAGLYGATEEDDQRDQMVEEYEHSGMKIQIYRDAGSRRKPTYFGCVVNPNVKNPGGAVITAKDPSSLPALKKLLIARAERKAELLARQRTRLEGASTR